MRGLYRAHSEIIHDEVALKRLQRKMMDISELAFDCLSADSELLTSQGWMRMDAYCALEKMIPVATTDPERGFRFEMPIQQVIKKYSGNMYHRKSDTLDMLMAKGHGVIYTTMYTDEDAVLRAEDLPKRANHLFIQATKGPDKRKVKLETFSDLDRLKVAVCADGSKSQDKTNSWVFCFRKERKIERLEKLLISCGIPYSRKCYTRKNGKVDTHFRAVFPSDVLITKRIADIAPLTDMSTDYAEDFIMELSKWDGSEPKGRIGCYVFNSGNLEDINYYAALAFLSGAMPYGHCKSGDGCYKTGCTFNKTRKMLGTFVEEVPGDGLVYCVKMRTKVFFARRNGGTPFKTHNTETNTLRVYGPNEDFRCIGISISWGRYNNYYIPLHHQFTYGQISEETFVKFMKPVFERDDITIVVHNMKFDFHVMLRMGIRIRTKRVFDTTVASWLCDENRLKGLKDLSKNLLHLSQTKFSEATELVSKARKRAVGMKPASKATYDLTYVRETAGYAMDDAFNTWQLYVYFLDELRKEGMWKIFKHHYMPFEYVLLDMEAEGVAVDQVAAAPMSAEMQKDMDKLMYRMVEILGVMFNPGSSPELKAILFGKADERFVKDKDVLTKGSATALKLKEHSFGFKPTRFTDKGEPSCDKTAILTIIRSNPKSKRQKEGVEFCECLKEYSRIATLKNTFVDGIFDKLYDDGRMHPSFNIVGTDSGRLSCASPNLQQLPRVNESDKYQIRKLFTVNPVNGEDYTMIACDESNLEMRILAYFSQDKNLLEMFAKGLDSHGSTAVNMFGLKCSSEEVKKLFPKLRQAAKTINFMLGYGGGAQKLYEALRDDEFAPIDLGAPEYLEEYENELVMYDYKSRRQGPPKTGTHIAQIYIKKYFAAYYGVAAYLKAVKKEAHIYGFVETIIGRKRRLHDINCGDRERESYEERVAGNAPIQGSAADIVSSAQIRISRDPEFKALMGKMVLQVHDEIVAICPKKNKDRVQEIIQHHMAHPFGVDGFHLDGVELRADGSSGKTYADAK